MYIDAHVHFRDFNQKNKETIAHGLEVARDSGLDAVLDMPNTDPPLMTRDLALDRLKIARNAGVPEVFYGMYLGLTADPEQIKQAVETYRAFTQVVGIKLYAGHSTGTLGVVNQEDQEIVYETLAKEGYDGVLAVHAEKEAEMMPKLWDPSRPVTHSYARPENAEIESVKDQIQLAYQTGFKGKLHIAHISSPSAVDLVVGAKGMDISCGVCPQYFVYDWSQMSSDDGVLWKVNPPIRNSESKEKMLQYLHEGKIDWIETDHAPHSLEEKTQNPFMSGIPTLPWWPLFEEYLRHENFSDREIEAITFDNIAARFEIDITRKNRKTTDRRNDYPFNPFKSLEEQLSSHSD